MFFAGLLIKYRIFIPGGRARGFSVKFYLQQLSKIFVDLQPRSGVCANYTKLSSPLQDLRNQNKLHATPQKDLTLRSTARIIGARPFFVSELHFRTGAETLPIRNYFAHTRKKDLTFLAFALILAQGALRFGTSLAHWRAGAARTMSRRA